MSNDTDNNLRIEIPSESGIPLYKWVAAEIEKSILAGQLAPGSRLPSQRDLATQLGINTTTVTRAYALLKQKQLVSGKAGRGTIVRGYNSLPENDHSAPHSLNKDIIDLTVNRPSTQSYTTYLEKTLPQLATDERFLELADYQPSGGPIWARKTGATWVSRFGRATSSEQVVVCAGAQHALAVTLTALCRSGDLIVTDNITYQGINGLAGVQGLEIHGIGQDEEGMRPDALDDMCRRNDVRAVFLVPSLHNPTTHTMKDIRRRELCEIAVRHDLIIIEDDVYAPLLDSRYTPFSKLQPERTVYLTSLSKSVAPGLRMGFIAAPIDWIPSLTAALRIDYWSGDPLSALIATKLIETGTAWDIIDEQKEELRKRVEIATKILSGLRLKIGTTSNHAWLVLPQPWHDTRFVAACYAKGVNMLAADAFTIGQTNAPNAVRINLSAARTRDELKHALQIIRKTLNQRTLQAPGII